MGIGTASPGETLHVIGSFGLNTTNPNSNFIASIYNAANKSTAIYIPSGGSSYSSWIGFDIPGVTGWAAGVASNGNYQIANNVNDVTSGVKVAVNTSGNVGIGTTSPSYTLDVNGTTRLSGVPILSATTGVIKSGPQGNANIIGDFVPVSTSISVSVGLGYLVRANSITLTLPSSAGLADGDKISFVPSSTSINNYTIGRNNSTIMGSASDLIVNVYAPFSLQWDGTGSNWVLA